MSLTPEQINQIAEMMKDQKVSDDYIIALVAEEEFVTTMMCPHCLSTNETVELVENIDLEESFSSMHLCSDCGQIFIVCSYPSMFQVSHPVFLSFTMKPGEPCSAKIVSTQMAKDIMARGDAAQYEDRKFDPDQGMILI